MISIDKFAYISELRKVNPMEKFLFSIITMFTCLFLNKISVSIVVFFLVSFITVYKGKIPFGDYCKLILIPLSFLVIGVVTIAINIGLDSNKFLFSFNILNWQIGCTVESIKAAIGILLKSIAAVSCLYFLTLTTPIVELLSVLKKFKVPKLFIELMGLIYRFIFILLDTVNMIYISQKSRLGYSTIKLGYNSLGGLITSLFIKSYKRSQDMYTALEARCYSGEINVIENEYTISYKNISMIIVLQILLVLFSYI